MPNKEKFLCITCGFRNKKTSKCEAEAISMFWAKRCEEMPENFGCNRHTALKGVKDAKQN